MRTAPHRPPRPALALVAAAAASLAACEKDTEHNRFAEGVAEEMFRSSLVIENSSRNLAAFSAAQAEAAARRGNAAEESAFRASAEEARRRLVEDQTETARRRGEFLGACAVRGLPRGTCEERAQAIERDARR
ncbi:MAG: hypothetical protein QM704_10735 [Anaeromyxobacteraceae bacterium]